MTRRTIVATRGGACLLFATALIAIGGCAHSPERELIEAYERHPSGETTNAVVETMAEGRFSRRDGNRALKLLVTPRVTARPTHRTDRDVSLLIEHPYCPEKLRLDSGTLMVGDAENKLVFGARPCLPFRRGPGHSSLSSSSDLIARASVRLPEGRHDARIVLSYAFRYRTRERKLKVDWGPVRKLMNIPMPDISWPKRVRRKSYTCDVTLPLTLEVRPPAFAPDVALRRDEALDAKMKECITARVYPDAANVQPSHVVESGEWRWAVALHGISIRALPESVAFRVYCIDEHGQRRPLPSFYGISCAVPILNPDPITIILRAHEQADLRIDPILFNETFRETCESEGRHRLTLVLEPDPEAAWRDPAVEAIWGGSIELPFDVWVTPR